MKQYPHTATFKVIAQGGKNPDTGDFEPGSELELVQPCRIEVGSGGQVATADGSTIAYAAKVFLKLLPVPIEAGVTLMVTDAQGATIASGPAKLARQNTYNAEVWL